MDDNCSYQAKHLNNKLLDGLEFCKITYALFEQTRNQPNGVNRLRLRPGHEIEKSLLKSFYLLRDIFKPITGLVDIFLLNGSMATNHLMLKFIKRVNISIKIIIHQQGF